MRKVAVFFIVLIIGSCKQPLNTIALDIQVEGMSCSHYCAPFIQKKLLNTEGVLDAKVSFENKLAKVVINANEISKEELIAKIETIADSSYKTGFVNEKKLESFNPDESKLDKSKTVDFDISKPEVTHSAGFQLPNLFSLLNSILN